MKVTVKQNYQDFVFCITPAQSEAITSLAQARGISRSAVLRSLIDRAMTPDLCAPIRPLSVLASGLQNCPHCVALGTPCLKHTAETR